MKKLFIILLFFILVSCNRYIVKNVYENTYWEEELAIEDVYSNLNTYDVDSISMDRWITNILQADTIVITQKLTRKMVTENSQYTFIFTEYMYPSNLFYHFLIRFVGREKDIEK